MRIRCRWWRGMAERLTQSATLRSPSYLHTLLQLESQMWLWSPSQLHLWEWVLNSELRGRGSGAWSLAVLMTSADVDDSASNCPGQSCPSAASELSSYWGNQVSHSPASCLYQREYHPPPQGKFFRIALEDIHGQGLGLSLFFSAPPPYQKSFYVKNA